MALSDGKYWRKIAAESNAETVNPFKLISLVLTFVISFCATQIHAGSCAEFGVFAKTLGAKKLIGFDGYFPIRLVTDADCDIRFVCSYDISFSRGYNLDSDFEAMQIVDICNSIQRKTEPIDVHGSTGKFTIPLRAQYKFSKRYSLMVTGKNETIEMYRTEYFGLLPDITWMSPTTESGKDMLSGTVGDSSYFFTLVFN
jgi:hypothetical protein